VRRAPAAGKLLLGELPRLARRAAGRAAGDVIVLQGE